MKLTDPLYLCAGDCLALAPTFADDSIDLLFTSPPYEDARTYGINFRLKGQAWVDWIVAIVQAYAPKVRGLMALVVEGRTSNYRYSGTPLLLGADLLRAGFNLRKPPIYQRYGTFGSGGPDWLRNDYESILCITRKGRLPYSHNTACGHPPKHPPGGNPSNRKQNGTRNSGKTYKPPALANPGNVIDCGAVGGGNMGSVYAHENEAPFPLQLAEFFVKSFCRPGGYVLDPFVGSGTTLEAALRNERKAVGIDLRPSQIELCKRRLKDL